MDDTSKWDPRLGPSVWVPLTSFVGRAEELADLEAMVLNHRLVTLLGPGGTGKTRLALALRDLVVRTTAMDVFVVELASLREARLVPAAIAQSLGVRGPSDRSAMDLAVERLSEGQPLLILDNLEQLDGIARPVRELLGRCPSLRILATSRRPLRISGEQRYAVEPLDTPGAEERSTEVLAAVESVALFVERSAAIDHEFGLDQDNAPVIAAICRHLDGLPLAIELAAARSGLLAPMALLGRLESRLGVLTEGAADAPRRQATLRDTIAWSHELLGVTEASTFEQASVFAGGFTEAAASSVLLPSDPDVPTDVLEALASLVEHSLMRVKPGSDGEPRFQMLETIREFAADHLADPEPVAARHADHFVAFAEAAEAAFEGPEQALWARRLADDIDNIRGALEWAYEARAGDILLRLAVAMGSWYFLGDQREGRRWLDVALGMSDHANLRLEAKALRLAANLAHGLAEHDAHDALIEAALVAARATGDDHGAAETMLIAASALIDRGDSEAASRAIARGLKAARRSGDAELVARLEIRLSIFSAIEGGRLIEVLEESVLAVRRSDNVRELGLTLANLSFAYLSVDRPHDALAAIDEAIEILERLGERIVLGFARLVAGLTNLRLGDAGAARGLLEDGISSAKRTGNAEDVIFSLEASAEWLGVTGHHADAVILWSAASQIRVDLDLPGQPIDQAWIGAGRARDERKLRSDRFEAASAIGMSLGQEAALDLAAESLRSANIAGPVAERSSTLDRFNPTPRELEVLSLLVDGCSDREIAERLFISPKTASVHVANLKGKLGASSRVEIATLAIRRGLATPSSDDPLD